MIDRLEYATRLSLGQRVLDIGGMGMPLSADREIGAFGRIAVRLMRLLTREKPGRPETSGFGRAYQNIRDAAHIYRAVDCHSASRPHFRLDLNRMEGVRGLLKAVDSFRPQVILCMETLEHLNYHYEVMNVIARAVDRYDAVAWITLPNNANWVLNAMWRNHDHVIGFFPEIAYRFISRSKLGAHNIKYIPCTQKYVWFWPLVHLAAFCQPISLGFRVNRWEP